MERVKQIELSLEDRPGSLSEISELLGSNNIHIIAFHISAEKGIGRLKLVANNPEKALNVLKTAGYESIPKEVIACELPHHPGGLNAVLKPLKNAGINVDDIYPSLAKGPNNDTVLIIGLGQVEKALSVLQENWIRILGEEFYHI